jgi:hypothetical protein
MDWFSAIWLVALVLALLTGKAYFRRIIVREIEPGHYWSTCCCYAVLAALMPALRIIKG